MNGYILRKIYYIFEKENKARKNGTNISKVKTECRVVEESTHNIITIDRNYFKRGDIFFYNDKRVKILSGPISVNSIKHKYIIDQFLDLRPGTKLEIICGNRC